MIEAAIIAGFSAFLVWITPEDTEDRKRQMTVDGERIWH